MDQAKVIEALIGCGAITAALETEHQVIENALQMLSHAMNAGANTETLAKLADIALGELTPKLRGWGNYFRTGNADREFNKIDGFVYRRLTGWLYRRGGQRTGRAIQWTSASFWNMGLHKLQGTVRYPSQAPSSKIIVKPYAGKPHVRFERGYMETGQPLG